MMILLRELAGLFVDDGALALAILAVVGLAGMAAVLMPNTPLAAGTAPGVWWSALQPNDGGNLGNW